MGIIDELRQRSCEKKEREHLQKNRRQQLEDNYARLVAPKMRQIFTYLKEIVDHLNYIALTMEITDYSNRFPQLGPLVQNDYKINTDGIHNIGDTDRLAQINLTCFLESEGSFTYHVEGKSRIEDEISFLHFTKIPFRWRYDISKKVVDTALFTVTRKIPVLFKFEVDFEASEIRLIIKNHENFAVHRESYHPEDIDEPLLDKIARYLLRKDREMVMLEISPEQRRAIREKAVKYSNLSDKIKHLFGIDVV
ncbi:MAG: hypothetical protein ACU833_05960 [Gammaproteobacteria bacterium]